MLPTLEYHRPASLEEAVALLATLDGALALAGGTDVIVDLRRGARAARHVVSLRDVDEMRGVEVVDGRLRLGASTTPAELAASEAVRSARPELLQAVAAFGNPQVRNRATIGGNLCTATSCADLPPLLVACGADVQLEGPEGRRTLPLEDLFTGPRTTALRRAEILVALTLPVKTPSDGAAYEPFGLRAASFITVAGVAAWLRVADGVCADARVVLGAVAPTAVLAREAGARLVGRPLGPEAIGEAAAAAREAAEPLTDVRGSMAYRTDLVEVLARRALSRAQEGAGA